MLHFRQLFSPSDEGFPGVDALYMRAFPWHEQRDQQGKLAALQQSAYQLRAWFDDKQFVGLTGSWHFSDYSYIEHLAIDDSLRGHGYGQRLLRQFLQESPLTILEIDPPVDRLSQQRLHFYQKSGFHCQDYNHYHPAYHDTLADHALHVLSFPVLLTAQQYQQFADDLRCHVMGFRQVDDVN